MSWRSNNQSEQSWSNDLIFKKLNSDPEWREGDAQMKTDCSDQSQTTVRARSINLNQSQARVSR